ncbi:GEVED domain-containing protein [Aquimarina sp. 2201CG1-2-11]|uniref:GEVED domain-containing protein n=1 Tax=Aquimarina discodermiae TaxID=3231043 RepID=UPI00346209C6
MFVINNSRIFFLSIFIITAHFTAKGQRIDVSNRSTINVNAPLGTSDQDVKRGTFIVLSEVINSPTNSCSAQLLNTVNQNGKYYLITASHCASEEVSIGDDYLAEVSINYESFNATSRTSSMNLGVVYVNGIVRAKYHQNYADLMLIEINEEDVLEQKELSNLYFTGWSLNDVSPIIKITGHPKADLKKVYRSRRKGFDHSYEAYAPDLYSTTPTYKKPLFTSYFLNPVNAESGASGSGVRDLNNRVTSIASRISSSKDDGVLDVTVCSPLIDGWYGVGYDPSLPKLQTFLDPNYTYVSSVPGGYGMDIGNNVNQPFLIDDSNFDLTLAMGAVGVLSQEANLNLYTLSEIQKDTESFREAIGGVYLKNGEVELKITTQLNNETIVLYKSRANTNTLSRGHFKEDLIKNLDSNELDQIVASLNLSRNQLSASRSVNIPVTIELKNTGNSPAKIRAIKIPGLGFRNSVEFFTPTQFVNIYTGKNANYEDCRALASSITYLNSFTVSVTDPDTGLSTIKTYTTGNNGGYVNLIQHEFPTFKAGSTVELQFPRTTDRVFYNVWIDYNNDKTFDDQGENVITNLESPPLLANNNGSVLAVSDSFVIPNEPNKGTRIRIAMRRGSAPPANGSGIFDIGEVEDYTVVIVPRNKNRELLVSGAISPLRIGTGDHIAKPKTDKALSTGTKRRADGSKVLVVTEVPVTDSSGNTSYATASVIDIQPTADPNDGDLYTFKVKEGYLAVDTSSELTSSTFNGKTILTRKLKVVNTATPVKVYGFNLTQGGSNKTYYSLQASDGDPYAITSPMELIPVSSISDGTSPTTPTPLSSSVNHADIAKHLTTGDKSGIAVGSATVIGIGVGIIFKFRRTLSRVPGQAMRMVKSCDSRSGGEGVSLLENTEL